MAMLRGGDVDEIDHGFIDEEMPSELKMPS